MRGTKCSRLPCGTDMYVFEGGRGSVRVCGTYMYVFEGAVGVGCAFAVQIRTYLREGEVCIKGKFQVPVLVNLLLA